MAERKSITLIRTTRGSDSAAFRPYGPGKFTHVIDRAIYGLTLDGGADEESGEVEGTGWRGLIRGRLSVGQAFEAIESAGMVDVTTDELAYLTEEACGGFIVSEDSQGFVTTCRYLPDEIENAWVGVLELDAAETNDVVSLPAPRSEA